MIEAVENHMPECVVIDEIGTDAETLAARSIAQRGVQLVATAHGGSLENLLRNPSMSDLIGGVHTVLVSDEEARRRGTSKSVQERKLPPTFTVAVEMVAADRWHVHLDVASSVDAMLLGRPPKVEVRSMAEDGTVTREAWQPQSESQQQQATAPSPPQPMEQQRVYTYAVRDVYVEQAIRFLGFSESISITTDLEEANGVLALRSAIQDGAAPWLRAAANEMGVPIYAIKDNSTNHAIKALRTMCGLHPSTPRSRFGSQAVLPEGTPFALMGSDDTDRRSDIVNPLLTVHALKEAQEAVEEVVKLNKPVELAPQAPKVLAEQVDLVKKYRLAHSVRDSGDGANGRLRILPASTPASLN